MVTYTRIREYRAGSVRNYALRRKATSRYPPLTLVGDVDRYTERCYCGQFTSDGATFVTCCQDETVRLYDVAGDRVKLRKSIPAMYMRWTITDTSLSPDQQYVVYSSMSPIINIA